MKKIGAKSFTHKHSSDECMRFFMQFNKGEESIKNEPRKRETSVVETLSVKK